MSPFDSEKNLDSESTEDPTHPLEQTDDESSSEAVKDDEDSPELFKVDEATSREAAPLVGSGEASNASGIDVEELLSGVERHSSTLEIVS